MSKNEFIKPTIVVTSPAQLSCVAKELDWRDGMEICMSFFTVWVWIILLVIPSLFTRGTRCLLILSISLGGLYIAYVFPRELMYKQWVLRGDALFFADFVFHHLPLLLILIWWKTDISDRDCFIFAFIVIVYTFLNDPMERYGLRHRDLGVLVVVTVIALALLISRDAISKKNTSK